LLLSASNKRFLGELADLEVGDRAEVSLASAAYGIAHGCRILRVHHVRETVRVATVMAAVLEARAEHRARTGRGHDEQDRWLGTAATSRTVREAPAVSLGVAP
jgi:hypothetical protein